MNRLTQRIKDEILEDARNHGKEDGYFSLSDRLDVQNYADYKEAAHVLNNDKEFKYTVYVIRYDKYVKIQYSPLDSKFYEYKQPSEVIEVLERLIDHIKRLDSSRDLSHSTYVKKSDKSLDILIEGMNEGEMLEIEIYNTLKSK